MDATQENMLVILAAAGVAAVLGLIVCVLSSRTLREEGVRGVLKRWLGR